MPWLTIIVAVLALRFVYVLAILLFELAKTLIQMLVRGERRLQDRAEWQRELMRDHASNNGA